MVVWVPGWLIVTIAAMDLGASFLQNHCRSVEQFTLDLNSTFSLTVFFQYDQCPNPPFSPRKNYLSRYYQNEVLYLAELEASEPPATMQWFW